MSNTATPDNMLLEIDFLKDRLDVAKWIADAHAAEIVTLSAKLKKVEKERDEAAMECMSLEGGLRAAQQAVAEKEAARKGWHDQYLDAKAAQYRAEDALRAAQQEVERNAKDAARYRWLRDCSIVRSDRTMYVLWNRYEDGEFTHSDFPSGERLDAAIDTALAVSQEKPE